jgi:hypothetical protein
MLQIFFTEVNPYPLPELGLDFVQRAFFTLDWAFESGKVGPI